MVCEAAQVRAAGCRLLLWRRRHARVSRLQYDLGYLRGRRLGRLAL